MVNSEKLAPEYRYLVDKSIQVFLSEDVEPSDGPGMTTATLARHYIEMCLDMLGQELVARIGVQQMYTILFWHLYKLGTITYDNGKYYVRLKLHSKTRKFNHLYGLDGGKGVRAIERKLGLRPIKVDSQLNGYDDSEIDLEHLGGLK